jgi:hypothetical protein
METKENSHAFSSEIQRPVLKSTSNHPPLRGREVGRREFFCCEVHRVAVRASIFARLAPLEGGAVRRRCCERSIVVNLEVVDVEKCLTGAKFARGAG